MRLGVVMEPTYNLFDGPDLMVAEKILQRRAQMLVHSCLYYEFDNKEEYTDSDILTTLYNEIQNVKLKVMHN